MTDQREYLKQKKRVVIKVGTTTVTYPDTGYINLDKLEKFVRILINLLNKGKEVIVVSSGAVGVGRKALGMKHKPETEAQKQMILSKERQKTMTFDGPKAICMEDVTVAGQ